MACYQVRFFNNLLSSEGKQFKCLQRAILVQTATTPEDALEKAARRFERLEHVHNWKDHAQFAEISMDIEKSSFQGALGRAPR